MAAAAAVLIGWGVTSQDPDASLTTIEGGELRTVPTNSPDGAASVTTAAETGSSAKGSSTTASSTTASSAMASSNPTPEAADELPGPLPPPAPATGAVLQPDAPPSGDLLGVGDGSIAPSSEFSVSTVRLPPAAHLIARNGTDGVFALINGVPQDAYYVDRAGRVTTVGHPFAQWHDVSQRVVGHGTTLGAVGWRDETMVLARIQPSTQADPTDPVVDSMVLPATGQDEHRLMTQGFAVDGQGNMLAAFASDPTTGPIPPIGVLDELGLSFLVDEPPCESTTGRDGDTVIGSVELCDGTVIPFVYDASDYQRQTLLAWLSVDGAETIVDADEVLGAPYNVISPVGIESGFVVVASPGSGVSDLFFSRDGLEWRSIENPQNLLLGPALAEVAPAHGPDGGTYLLIGSDIARIDASGVTMVGAVPGASTPASGLQQAFYGSAFGFVFIEDLGGSDGWKRIWITDDLAGDWREIGDVSGNVVYASPEPDGAAVVIVESSGRELRHHRISLRSAAASEPS